MSSKKSARIRPASAASSSAAGTDLPSPAGNGPEPLAMTQETLGAEVSASASAPGVSGSGELREGSEAPEAQISMSPSEAAEANQEELGPTVLSGQGESGDDLAVPSGDQNREMDSPVNYDEPGLLEVQLGEHEYRFDTGKQGTALCVSGRSEGTYRWGFLGEVRWDGRDLRSRAFDRKLLGQLSVELRRFAAEASE